MANASPASYITRLLPAAAGLLVLAACQPREPAPLPTRPAPVARPVPPPAVPVAEWRDAAITAGTWTWAREGTQSVARFGITPAATALSFACAAGQVTLARAGTAPASVALTLRTTNGNRTVSAGPLAGAPAVLAVPLAGRDPLLDMIAFSRGRFAVEVPGLATLYVPSWPEISRVIEDCR